jgi:Ca2+-binding RTX toxin-like protein
MSLILLTWREWRPVLPLVAFVCLLVLGLAPRASASGSGFFSPTGEMSVPREGAAAAPLPEGQVLVAGGRYYDVDYNPEPGAYPSSAEVFDPATGTFSSAVVGSMGTPRWAAAAAPLPDGRVLVAGGYYFDFDDGTDHLLSSAEIFDPATGTFSSAGVGSMSVPRFGAAVARLPNGRVLVAGGNNGTSNLSSAEIFDPATNQFNSSGVGSMVAARFAPAAAPLPDGRVLVAGGSDGSGGLSSAEVFDPATKTFSSAGIGSLSVPRERPLAAPLPDGRVLVAGGHYYDHGGGHYLSSAEVFDPATGTFSSAGIGSMEVARDLAAAAPLSDGRVLIAGGSLGVYGGPLGFHTFYLSNAEIFALGAPSPPHTPPPAQKGPSATCKGKQASIVGTIWDDQITGTPAADVIAGLDGSDQVSGLDGNDLICGGGGNDTLTGSAGNDQLIGQQGDDRLYGQKGNDKLGGKGGKDTLKGGPGKDILKGGAGKDILKGGAGKDKQVQ